MKPRRPQAAYDPIVPGYAVPFDVVQARRFELVDRNGRIRGGFGFTANGSPMVALTEDHGGGVRIRAAMFLDPTGPRISLCDAEGKSRVVLGFLDESGEAVIGWRDGQGKPFELGFGDLTSYSEEPPPAPLKRSRGRPMLKVLPGRERGNP